MCVALVIAGRRFAHQRAIALLDSREYRGQTPLVVAAFPRPSNPLLWSGVVETDNALFNLEVPLGPGREFDPELADVHFKPEPSATLKNAVASSTAIEFLNFARFPLASVQPEGPGFQVRLRDMRFASELAGRRGIIAVIDLNAQSLVIGEHLEFDSQSGIEFSSTGFSLWGLVLARTNPHRLKPVLLKTRTRYIRRSRFDRPSKSQPRSQIEHQDNASVIPATSSL